MGGTGSQGEASVSDSAFIGGQRNKRDKKTQTENDHRQATAAFNGEGTREQSHLLMSVSKVQETQRRVGALSLPGIKAEGNRVCGETHGSNPANLD